MKTSSLIFALFTALMLIIPCLTYAVIINVPEDIETIQGAIEAADNRDTVLVQPGEYDENINFSGKRITVGSLILVTHDPNFIENTIIDGGERDAVVTFDHGETPESILCGFTIQNGFQDEGGGIEIQQCSPVLQDLIITQNSARSHGGGIYCNFRSEPLITNVRLEQNHANVGGGIFSRASDPILRDVVVSRNTADQWGGGISFWGGSGTLEYVLVTENQVEGREDGGGISSASANNVIYRNVTICNNLGGLSQSSQDADISSTVVNCIIRDNGNNQVSSATDLAWDGTSSMTISFSDIEGGRNGVRTAGRGTIDFGEGNIDEDPLFGNPDEDDYHLNEDSPCIDTGDPDSPEDLDGTRADMGGHRYTVGYIEGFVLDIVDDSPIAEAEITSSIGNVTQSDEDGYFIMPIVAELEFDLTASRIGYNDNLLEDLRVGLIDTIEVEFNMTHPELIVSEDRFETEIDAGEAIELQFDISNEGNGPLDWWMTKHLSGEDAVEHWTIRDEIMAGQMLDDNDLRGVLYIDDRFFISGSNDDAPVIYVLNHEGEEIAIIDQPGNDVYGMRDLAYDGELLWGATPNMLYGVTLDGEIEVELDPPFNPTSCIAWDSDLDQLWVCSTTSEIKAIDRQGNEVEAHNRQGLRMYGLAYWPSDQDGYNLYIYNMVTLDEGRHPALHKMNTETGDIIFVRYLDTERGGNPCGAFITNQYDIYNNWVLLTTVSTGNNQGRDRIDIWQLGANVDWMVLEPSEGLLNAGESVELTLTIDTEGLCEIEWEGELVFDHAVAVEEVIVPVNVIVGDGNQGNGRIRLVTLSEGWNLISINVNPGEEFYFEDEDRGPNIILMTEQLRINEDNHHIRLMKNENGQFYAPMRNFNNIPYWDLSEGYLINVDEDVEATWAGESIPFDADIPLEEDWNLIAYYPTYELDANQPDFYALSSIIDHVIIAKDAQGHFMLPGDFNFSNMPPWRETQGYQVKVDEDVVLNYPPEQEEVVNARSEEKKQSQRLHRFDRKEGTGENMSLLVLCNNFMNGEIGVYTKDRLVGSGVIRDGRCGIAVWGDDPTTEKIDGALQYEKFDLMFADENGIRNVNFEILEGDGAYHPDDFLAIRLLEINQAPTEFGIVSAFPNPFNSNTIITYNLTESGYITLNLFDLNGRQVVDVISREAKAGQHSVTIAGLLLPSGVYLAELQMGGKVSKQKLTLVR